MDIKKIINKQPLGSIERLFLIYLYKLGDDSKAAFRCVNNRLDKMSKSERLQTCKRLSSLYAMQCFIGKIVICRHWFSDGVLKLK